MNYRTLLKTELAKRCEANTRYSQRAFARDLGMTASRLSEVLSGRYGLSLTAAAGIAKRIGLKGNERLHFLDLVESEHARSKIARQAAHERLKANEAPNQLQMDAFAIISDWYHFALLELMSLDDFVADPRWAAKKLGIHESEVELALTRLKRLELIEEKNGKLVASDDQTFSPEGVPSEAIKKFHKQVISRATQALYLQSLDEREFGTSILAIDRKKIPEAKKAIRDFRKKFCRDMSTGKNKDDVYCISMQFFSLIQGNKESSV